MVKKAMYVPHDRYVDRNFWPTAVRNDAILLSEIKANKNEYKK